MIINVSNISFIIYQCVVFPISAVQCSNFTVLNGQLSNFDTTFGSVVNISCDIGHQISGEWWMEIHCQANGTWSYSPTACQREQFMIILIITTHYQHITGRSL